MVNIVYRERCPVPILALQIRGVRRFGRRRVNYLLSEHFNIAPPDSLQLLGPVLVGGTYVEEFFFLGLLRRGAAGCFGSLASSHL